MTYKQKGGLLTAIILILVVALIVGALAAMSSGFTNWDVKTWFGGNNEETAEKAETDETDKSGAVIGESVGKGMLLASASIAPASYEEYGVSPMAETAYTLTVQITPSTVTNKNVDWAVAFSNSSSSWASGKTVTDYVTVTPASSDSLTATVECKQAFGEQIIVTCTSQQNSDIKGTCTVDYYKKVKSVDFSCKYGDSVIGSFVSDSDGVYRVDYTGEDIDYIVDVNPIYSDFTIDMDYSIDIAGSFSSEFGFSSGTFSEIILPAGLSGGGTITAATQEFVDMVYASFDAYIDGDYSTCASIILEGAQYVSDNADILNDDEQALPFVNKFGGDWILILSINTMSPMSDEEISSYWENATSVDDFCVENGIEIPVVNEDDNFLNITIDSTNDLLEAAQNCNDSECGILNYTISFMGVYDTYEYTFAIGYTDSSIQAIQNIVISGSIIF